jgi:hypothetical protein
MSEPEVIDEALNLQDLVISEVINVGVTQPSYQPVQPISRFKRLDVPHVFVGNWLERGHLVFSP